MRIPFMRNKDTRRLSGFGPRTVFGSAPAMCRAAVFAPVFQQYLLHCQGSISRIGNYESARPHKEHLRPTAQRLMNQLSMPRSSI